MSTSQAIAVGTKLRAVTPSDSALIGCSALYVGTTGNIAIVAEGDTAAVVLTTVPAGAIIPIACAQVLLTGTTAANIVAIFA